MPKTSKATAPNFTDFGMASECSDTLDDYAVDFVTIAEDHSLEQFLKGLPDDACQCPHWGYVFAGSMSVSYHDGRPDETFSAGDAFYMAPGHVPAAVSGTQLVQFSPKKELDATMAAIQANQQAAH
jgi:hypothetical protein